MSGITELAKILKERENNVEYSPMFGRIIALPDLKVWIGDKVILAEGHIKSCAFLAEKDIDGDYINLGKEVVLLPYANNQKFIVIGVVE